MYKVSRNDEFYFLYQICAWWLILFAQLSVEGGTEEEKKGRQKRGGKGLVHTKKTTGKSGPKKINVSRAPRGKKKSVTGKWI